jgi:DNA-binding protein HU-beta
MTKREVIRRLREKTGLPLQEATLAVEAFFSTIKQGLSDGDKVSLVGFGTFSIRRRDARAGRNPRTGESVQVPPRHTVIFKAGKSFRELLNE